METTIHHSTTTIHHSTTNHLHLISPPPRRAVENVRHLSSLHAGVVMFSGQIFDALATPIAGLLADATPGWPLAGFGGRMLWYVVGTALAVASFLGVFAFSPFARDDSRAAVLYFSAMASTFNVGWAAVQVRKRGLGWGGVKWGPHPPPQVHDARPRVSSSSTTTTTVPPHQCDLI